MEEKEREKNKRIKQDLTKMAKIKLMELRMKYGGQ